MVVKTVANKSSNKVYIIQSIDRKLPIDDIASAKGMKVDELLTEIETIVESGTRVDLNYYIQDILDEYQEEELEDFLKNLNKDRLKKQELNLKKTNTQMKNCVCSESSLFRK